MNPLDLSGLNELQKEAVMWSSGPLLVLAGPGSGKTRVLTMRAGHLLAGSPGERFRILAVTFTVKAANEMAERLEGLVGPELRVRVRVSTFHAFAAELLRQHGSHIGLAPNFEIVADDVDRQALLSEVVSELEEDDFALDPKRLLALVDLVVERSWSSAEAGRFLHDTDLGGYVHEVGSKYQRMLVSSNLLDFPGIISHTSELLRRFPGVARQVQTVFLHILVDEFQDTNPAQFALLKLLVGENRSRLFVVGDDDQIIYQWNGASPRRIDQLVKDFQASVLQLPTNYRCPAPIVRLANNLIRNNAERTIGKAPLIAIKAESPVDVVRLQGFSEFAEELAWIANDITERALSRNEVVLLCRSNRLAKEAVAKLNDAGVPCAQPKRKQDFDSPELRLVASILRAVNAPTNGSHLERVAQEVFRLVGARPNLELATELAIERGTTAISELLLLVSSQNDTSRFDTQVAKAALGNLVQQVRVREFVDQCVSLASAAASSETRSLEPDFEGLEEDITVLRDLAKAFTRSHGAGSIGAFVQELQLSPKTVPVPRDTVKCLTVHTAKGLEFEHVYLFGMVEGQFPSFQSVRAGDDSQEMEEERRNCFVAVTRAASTLTITLSEEYFGYGCLRSRFLQEMGIDTSHE